MNKIKQTNIKIKRDILSLAFCGKYKASFAHSPSARELYVIHRLRISENPRVLCIALGKNECFKAEAVVNRDLSVNPHRFADVIINFAKENTSQALLLGFYTENVSALASSDEFSRYVGTLYVLLKRHAVALNDVILVSEHDEYSIFNEDI